MKIYPHLFSKLFCTPLMVLPGTFRAFEKELLGRMGVSMADIGKDQDIVEAEARSMNANRRSNALMETVGDVAVVHVDGVIDKAISDADLDCYGGCDLDDVNRALSVVASNPAISRLVMHFNTPGGSVTGVPETAQRIASMRQNLEIHAFTDNLCCSAGYYLASQADVIAAAPSATVGSIGVYMALLDETKALEMEGLKVNLIKAGAFKAMGASFQELQPEERAMLETSVKEIYTVFKAACTSLRTIADSDMQGQSFSGANAKSAKLVDELTGDSLDEYVSALLLQ